VEQVNLSYNGFVRRWDWQTLQCKVAGSIYNTGPHPIGLALGFLDFDEKAYLAFSRLAVTHTEGDAEDYSKLIITAPGKAVVDIETNCLDAYPEKLLKICGTLGTFVCNPTSYELKYIVDGENPARPVIRESLKNDDGMPAYCGEKLVIHEESGEFEGTAFNSAVSAFYDMLFDKIAHGVPLKITPEMASAIIGIIEQAHAENPLPVKY
jgi:predicted dehydrogenase